MPTRYARGLHADFAARSVSQGSVPREVARPAPTMAPCSPSTIGRPPTRAPPPPPRAPPPPAPPRSALERPAAPIPLPLLRPLAPRSSPPRRRVGEWSVGLRDSHRAGDGEALAGSAGLGRPP